MTYVATTPPCQQMAQLYNLEIELERQDVFILWRPVLLLSTSACRAQLKCSFKMDRCENDTDDDEKEWESSFMDSDPFELAVAPDAAAGSGFSSAFYLCQSVILTFYLSFRSEPRENSSFNICTQNYSTP